MKWFIVLGLLATSTTSHAGIYEFLFGHDNYYECILYEMPEAQSDKQADELHKQCRHDYPLTIPLTRKESYLEVETADQCIQEFVQQTKSPEAKRWIKNACYKVYIKK